MNKSAPDAPPTFIGELVGSAVRPSFGSAAGAIVIALLCLMACTITFTPDFMRRIDPAMLMTRPNDDYAYSTVRAFHLQDAAPDEPTVVLLGASSLKHAISSEEEMSDLISVRTGRDIPVANLTIPGMSIWEAASICDFIATPNDVFVLAMSAKKVASNPATELGPFVRRPRLGFQTEAWMNEIELAGFDAPKGSGNYFFDNFKFFMARRNAAKNLITGPVNVRRHNDDRERLSEGEWDAHMTRILADYGDYDANHQANFAVVARTIELLRSRGVKYIILLEPPVNPAIVHLLNQDMLEKYDRDVQEFAREHDVEYWQLNETVDLQDDDFYDWTHVRKPEVRRKYTEELSRRLSELWPVNDAEGATS